MRKHSFQHIEEAVSFLRNRGFGDADAGIILGTGLSRLISDKEILNEIFYQDIPHFPVSTVESHAGKLVIASINNRKVLIMQGRFHFYEGYSMQQISIPVRVMKFLGIKYLLISNAAGALNPAFAKGGLMLLNDHINLSHSNPLIGANDERLGPRFPDMSEPYSRKINALIKKISKDLSIQLYEGVYAMVKGPNLETRAEYRFLWNIGADAVGMSTVPEVISARHLNLPCAAVSVITDECDPDQLHEANISEIIEVARNAEPKLSRIFKAVIERYEN